jgi:hypothetical protein
MLTLWLKLRQNLRTIIDARRPRLKSVRAMLILSHMPNVITTPHSASIDPRLITKIPSISNGVQMMSETGYQLRAGCAVDSCGIVR